MLVAIMAAHTALIIALHMPVQTLEPKTRRIATILQQIPEAADARRHSDDVKPRSSANRIIVKLAALEQSKTVTVNREQSMSAAATVFFSEAEALPLEPDETPCQLTMIGPDHHEALCEQKIANDHL